MKPFTSKEVWVTLVTLASIVTLSLYNFGLALRRARDAQRIADINAVSNALNKFLADFGFFPYAEDGKIVACKSDNFDELVVEVKQADKLKPDAYLTLLKPCDWGKSEFRDLLDASYPAYLTTLPQDPQFSKGSSYIYLSNGTRYQLYASLEGEDGEDQYNQGVVSRQLDCGTRVCNFGKALGETPLDKTIEEYENELLLQKNKS